MRFTIDLDSLELVKGATDSQPVVQVDGKRGDGIPFEVTFVRSGIAEPIAGGSVLTFGAKQAGKYDAAAVVLASDFTLSGSGSTAKYSASPSFNTAALNALFLIDGNDGNDPPFVDLMAEFTWQYGAGAPTSTKTFAFRVFNDVVRDSELSPTPAAVPIGTSAPVNSYAGVFQVETVTVLGTVSASGNASCIFTTTESEYTFYSAVVAGDIASVVAGKIRSKLNIQAEVTNFFTVGGTGAVVTLTALTAVANDAALSLVVGNSTSTGITTASSVNTTAGVAAVTATAAPPFLRVAGGFLYIQEAGVWKKTALSAL